LTPEQIIIVCPDHHRNRRLSKCIDFKCVRKPTNSRLTHTMQTNPAAEQNIVSEI